MAEHWSCKPGVESSILSGGSEVILILFDTSSTGIRRVLMIKHYLQWYLTPLSAQSIGTQRCLWACWICWSLCSHGASLAQWQSTGLVNQGSWVQISQEATLLRFLTFIQACRSYLISRKLKVQLYMLLGLLFIWLIPRFPNRMDTRDGRHGLKKATYMLLAPATLSVTAPRWHLHWRVPVRIRLDRELIREEHFLKIECTGSLAEWSKALVLGTSPKGRGFESHSCQETFWGYLTLNFGSKRFCSRWGSNSQPRHISCTSDCHISTVR